MKFFLPSAGFELRTSRIIIQCATSRPRCFPSQFLFGQFYFPVVFVAFWAQCYQIYDRNLQITGKKNLFWKTFFKDFFVGPQSYKNYIYWNSLWLTCLNLIMLTPGSNVTCFVFNLKSLMKTLPHLSCIGLNKNV